jgi:hypothetical protein
MAVDYPGEQHLMRQQVTFFVMLLVDMPSRQRRVSDGSKRIGSSFKTLDQKIQRCGYLILVASQ